MLHASLYQVFIKLLNLILTKINYYEKIYNLSNAHFVYWTANVAGTDKSDYR